MNILDLPTLNNPKMSLLNASSTHNANDVNMVDQHESSNTDHSLPPYHAYSNAYQLNPAPFLSSANAGHPNSNNSQTQSTTSSLSTSTASPSHHNTAHHTHSHSHSHSLPLNDLIERVETEHDAVAANELKPNYANLRKNGVSTHHQKTNSHSLHTAPPISHATRIPPTNLSYSELLSQHQFTPSGGSVSTSPIKHSFTALHLDANHLANTATATATGTPNEHTTPNGEQHHRLSDVHEDEQDETHGHEQAAGIDNHHHTSSNSHNHNTVKHRTNHHHRETAEQKLTSLEAQREAFRKRPIIEEPKKNITGYQLFAKWKRAQKQESGFGSTQSICQAWNELSSPQKDQWNKKSEQAKVEYHHKFEEWLNYVEEAKRLGLPVPTKSIKPIIQQIKIKNLLNLIPDMAKYNKETQFIISKATEQFIQFYASKALEISTKLSQTVNNNAEEHPNHNHNHHRIEHTISGQHCFDALQTDHKFNFLRAVTVKPTNLKPAKPRRRSPVKKSNTTTPNKKNKNQNTKKRSRDEEDIHDDNESDDDDRVVVSPSNHNTNTNSNSNKKRGNKRKASSINSSTSTTSNSSSNDSDSHHNNNNNKAPSPSRKKRRKLSADSESSPSKHAQAAPPTTTTATATAAGAATTNQIITNHEYIHVPPPYYMNGYHPASAYYAHPYYAAAAHQPAPFASIATSSIAGSGAPPSSQASPPDSAAAAATQHLTPTALYQQPPTPFHPNFYNPHQLTHPPPLPTTSANGGSQIVNVQQIFGGDD